MRWARYEGIGSFPQRRWQNDLRWRGIVFWPEEEALWPTVIDLSVDASRLGARLQDARLTYVEGLAGSNPRFTSDWLRGGALFQRTAMVSVSLKYVGRRGAQVVLSGAWHEKGQSGLREEPISLQGEPVALGVGEPQPAGAPEIQLRCNVQHLALPLEALIKKLAEGRELSASETQSMRACISEYESGSCGSQRCSRSACSLRQSHGWLEYLRYKDVRDVLDTGKSGVHEEPPRLRARAGVETLALTALQRPGHYNP